MNQRAELIFQRLSVFFSDFMAIICYDKNNEMIGALLGKGTYMKKNQSLVFLYVAIPLVCIVLIILGVIFDHVKLAVYAILACVLIAILSKIIMAISSVYRSHIHKKTRG